MDARSLFKIVGEEGPLLRRVEEAMAWLLSHRGEKIGERLLQEAHALHGKPLTIMISELEQTGYYNLLGEHAIHLNPKHLAGTLIKASNGANRASSIERALAHEMVHAGQRGAASAESGLAFQVIRGRAQAAATAHFTPEQLLEHNTHLVEAANASDYQTVMQHVHDYVDKVALPIEESVRHHMQNDPAFRKYVSEIEAPAVAVENHIAKLRGEPLRGDYATAHEIEPQALRQMMIDQLSSDLAITTKKTAVVHPNQVESEPSSWTERIQKGRSHALQGTGPSKG